MSDGTSLFPRITIQCLHCESRLSACMHVSVYTLVCELPTIVPTGSILPSM